MNQLRAVSGISAAAVNGDCSELISDNVDDINTPIGTTDWLHLVARQLNVTRAYTYLVKSVSAPP